MNRQNYRDDDDGDDSELSVDSDVGPRRRAPNDLDPLLDSDEEFPNDIDLPLDSDEEPPNLQGENGKQRRYVYRLYG